LKIEVKRISIGGPLDAERFGADELSFKLISPENLANMADWGMPGFWSQVQQGCKPDSRSVAWWTGQCLRTHDGKDEKPLSLLRVKKSNPMFGTRAMTLDLAFVLVQALLWAKLFECKSVTNEAEGAITQITALRTGNPWVL
jgi:hypothetical protein